MPFKLKNNFFILLLTLAALGSWQWHDLEHSLEGARHEAMCQVCVLGTTPDLPQAQDLTALLTPPRPVERIRVATSDQPVKTLCLTPAKSPRSPPPLA